jgi:hypothetical protein
VHFQSFEHAVEYEANPYRRNKESDDARRGVDPHGPNTVCQLSRIGKAETGHDHRRHDRRRNADLCSAESCLTVEAIPMIVAMAGAEHERHGQRNKGDVGVVTAAGQARFTRFLRHEQRETDPH